MKKIILIVLLALGLMGTTVSYAQEQLPSQKKGKKIEKKEEKMAKKECVGAERKADMKKEKMEKKEAKKAIKEEKGK
jgi:hypothetical protein